MNKDQIKNLNQLKNTQENLTNKWDHYWSTYSNIDTWQFWINFLLFIVPLIILYFKIDKKKAFHLGFYGYSIHMLSTYIDGYATRHGLWEYPYKLTSILPINFGLDTSLIPIVYIFVYQWTLNHKKNYYIYAILTSVFFAFIFKPILVLHNLIRLSNGSNYFHLFLFYFSGSLIAKWITNVFFHFEKKNKEAKVH